MLRCRTTFELFLGLSLIAFVSSCSTFNYKGKQGSIYIQNTAIIKYTGKGAGASFALMGAMGPMGAAIGVAIDEGISKDIRKNIETSGIDLKAELCARLAKKNWTCVASAQDAVKNLTVSKFELTSKGSDDLIQATLVANMESAEEVTEVKIETGETDIALDKLKQDKNAAKQFISLLAEKLVAVILRPEN